jgi:hypothetical protein
VDVAFVEGVGEEYLGGYVGLFGLVSVSWFALGDVMRVAVDLGYVGY